MIRARRRPILAHAALAALIAASLAAPAIAGKKSAKEKRIDRHVFLAEYYVLREGDLDQAIKEYRSALRLDRRHLSAGLGLASVYLQKKEPEKAVKVLDRLTRLRKKDDSARVWQVLGQARVAAGDKEGAMDAWRKAIELNPKDSSSRWQLFTQLNARYRSGESNLADEVREAAEEYMRVARLRKGPNFQLAERTMIELTGDSIALAIYDGRQAYKNAFNSARFGTINEKMSEARKGFEKCLDEQPKNQECHFWLGKVLSSVKASEHYDIDEARKHFRKASKLPQAWVERGRLLRHADRLDAAAKRFRKALALDDDHQAALVQLAIVYKLQGEEGAAVTLLVKAYRADRRSSFASQALDELSKINPKHELLKAGMYFGQPAGDIFSTDRFVAAVDLVERQLGGVERGAPETKVLEEILARLMDAADVSSEQEIEVQVLRTKMPNAMALPNGNIYFTRGMLDYIKKSFPKRKLDADNDVLGFVMAHELSHVIREHTLRSTLYREAIKDASKRIDPAVITHVTRLQEIEADRVGIVLSFLAGYNPRGGILLMEAEGKEKEIPRHLNHPTFEERIHYLEEYWSNDVKYAFLSFRHGVNAMAKARRFESYDMRRAMDGYREAVEHFRRYRNTLKPTKRVLNNLGVAYAKIGIFELSDRGSPLHRWIAPMSIERESALKYKSVRGKASARRTRSIGEAPRPPVELERAVMALKEATRRDPAYSRARANLAVVYLALGQPKKALGILKKTRVGRGASMPKLVVLRGVAYAELGQHGTAARAFKRARKFHRLAKRASDYNMARLYQVAGKKDEARSAYQKFLKRWPKGVWAKAARKALEELNS